MKNACGRIEHIFISAFMHLGIYRLYIRFCKQWIAERMRMDTIAMCFKYAFDQNVYACGEHIVIFLLWIFAPILCFGVRHKLAYIIASYPVCVRSILIAISNLLCSFIRIPFYILNIIQIFIVHYSIFLRINADIPICEILEM